MEKSVGNTVTEQKDDKSKLQYFVRLIGKDGQPTLSEFPKEGEAMKYAKENDKPKEGEYAHAYDRNITDEKGNYKKIYPINQKT